MARRACALRAFVWIGICTAWFAAFAARAEEAQRQAAEIVRALQLERELQAISQAASAGLEAGAQALPATDRLLLRATVAAGFDPDALRRLLLGSLAARVVPEHANAVIDWLARPATRNLLDRAAAPTAEPEDASRSASSEESLARDALLRRFDRVRGRDARERQDAALVLNAMLRVANPLLPQEQRYSAREITRLVDAQRTRSAVAAPQLEELRQRYCNVPTSGLRGALDFLESPAGRWLRRTVDTSLEHALVTAAEATAGELIDIFGSGAAPVPLRSAEAAAR